MEIIENAPQVGRCDYCGRFSIRLLDAPLVKIPECKTRPYDGRGDIVWFKSLSCVPADLYHVIDRADDGSLICLAPEANIECKYCYLCFDGHVAPSLRDYCINMPREMQFDPDHPWWDPKWISVGREQFKRQPS